MRNARRTVVPAPRRRKPAPRRSPPDQSRLTVRAPDNAPLVRRERLAEALRESREAVSDLERQLDALLASLRQTGAPRREDVDSLHLATSRASAAMTRVR